MVGVPWNVTCTADGDLHGSVDSLAVQAKLSNGQYNEFRNPGKKNVHYSPSNGQLLVAVLDSPLAPLLDDLRLALPD